MITLRRAGERGGFDHGWLDTRHTFSFADYHDPRHMGFRHLRVINEDRVQGGQGFPRHGHRDMEIISYVLEGELRHHDSLGNGSVIRSGDVQRMSAGTGVLHSEANASPDTVVHFLQIWLLPGQAGLAPGYEQKTFSDADKRGRLRLVASPDGRDGSVMIHQNVELHAAILDPGRELVHKPAPGRHAWLQVARGAVTLNGARLDQGDGAAVSDEPSLAIVGVEPAEVLLFDLA
ncbi:MAG: pirin family protein [Candidatus Rokubacteria bacterium]|nr:pirin family protein [Candidatus Rokubacteria bacterium]MBI3826844.1 pirin family protein [Candidatus Rokubacteria bacterium]